MTSEAEEQLVHDVLAELIENTAKPGYLLFMRAVKPIERGHVPPLLQRLKNYQVVTSTGNDPYIIQLTPLGTDIARHPGGYLGYKAEEASKQQRAQAAQLERDRLDQQTAQATVDGVRANWWAVRVSIAGVLIGAIFSIISLIQSVNTATELEIAKRELILLKQQIRALTIKKSIR